MISVSVFLSGIAMATFAASGVFFLKFWQASRDRFFLFFGVGTWLIAFERLIALFVQGMQEPVRTPSVEASSWVYLIRLSAFLIILFAVYEKNRPQKN